MKVAVIGGGLSGLTTAWKLKKKFNGKVEISIYESQNACGGWIRSHHIEDTLCEAGPRGFKGSGKGLKTLELVHELQISDQLELSSDILKKRYLGIDQKLQKIPTNPLSLPFTSFGRTILKAIIKERKIPFVDCEESIFQFFERRFGKKIVNQFVDPFISGIFAGDPKTLSLTACFPEIKRLEKDFGSICKALLKIKKNKSEGFLYFRNGMAVLVDALLNQLKNHNTELFFGHPVSLINKNKEEWEVITPYHTAKYDKIILALPAHKLFHLINDEVTRGFLSVPFASVATVHVIYQKIQKIPEGFGFLIPSSEKSPSLGVIFDSTIHNNTHCTHLSVLLGGIKNPLIINEPADRLIKFALETLKNYLQISKAPDHTLVQIAHRAIPQYPLGYPHQIKELENKLKNSYPGIYITGSSYYGIGVNDCVDQAEKTALSVFQDHYQ